MQSLLPSRDGGRDGAFAGTWKCQGYEDLNGRFVIQCKFTGNRDGVIKAADLSDEVEKVKRLVHKKRCDVLITNAGLSWTADEEIALFKNAGAKHVLTLGAAYTERSASSQKHTRAERLSLP